MNAKYRISRQKNTYKVAKTSSPEEYVENADWVNSAMNRHDSRYTNADMKI